MNTIGAAGNGRALLLAASFLYDGTGVLMGANMTLDQHLQDVTGLVIIVFLCIVAILWFFLPFAVFGLKKRLDEQIANQKRIIELEDALSREILAPSARPRQEIGRQMHEDRGLLAQ